MTDKDTGWRPKGAVHTYDGYEVWDHDDFGPHLINDGQADPENPQNPVEEKSDDSEMRADRDD